MNVLAELEDFAAITGPATRWRRSPPSRSAGSPRCWLNRRRPSSSGRCAALVQKQVPFRVLGAGGGLLVRDEGVRGVVLRLAAPAFAEVVVQGKRAAPAAARRWRRPSRGAAHNLVGFESLVGMPGTVGGACASTPAIAPPRSANSSARSRCSIATGSATCANGMNCTSSRAAATSTSRCCSPPNSSWSPTRRRPCSSGSSRRGSSTRRASRSATRRRPGCFAIRPGSARRPDRAGRPGRHPRRRAQVNDRNANYVVADPGTSARDVSEDRRADPHARAGAVPHRPGVGPLDLVSRLCPRRVRCDDSWLPWWLKGRMGRWLWRSVALVLLVGITKYFRRRSLRRS